MTMQHAYVRDGAIAAVGIRAVRAAIIADGGPSYDDNWFKTIGTADKKAAGVYEVIDLDPGPQPDFVDKVKQGLVYDADAKTVSQPYALLEWPFERAREEVRRRLRARFRTALNKGVDVTVAPGVTAEFQTGTEAQTELRGLITRLARVGGTQTFHTRSGAVVTADHAQAQAVYNAVEDYIAAINTTDATHGTAINAAATVADLRGIDIEAGWPA